MFFNELFICAALMVKKNYQNLKETVANLTKSFVLSHRKQCPSKMF